MHGAGTGLFADAERVERSEGIGAELDAGTDFAELRCLFEHLDLEASPHQGERSGDTADAAAGNEDGK